MTAITREVFYYITPDEGTFSKSESPTLGRLPSPLGKHRFLKQKCHNAAINITSRSVKNTPAKKPPVPDSLGFVTGGNSGLSVDSRHCDSLVLLHA